MSDTAATDAVVAKEIARLRMKDRENITIIPPNRVNRCARGLFHGPAFAFPDNFLETSPKETPTTQLKRREPHKHDDPTPCPQLKTHLEF